MIDMGGTEMVLRVKDLLTLVQKAVDEGHAACTVEARNVAGDFDYLDDRNVTIEQKRGGQFEMRIDPSNDRGIKMLLQKYTIHARTDNYEEYIMSIVAKSDQHADQVAEALCEELDLILLACVVESNE